MKAVIAGGGTGGHIYPGIAIAEELQKRNIENAILFIGTEDGLERDVISRERFSLKFIRSKKVTRKLSFGLLLVPFHVLVGFFQAREILKEYAPDIVISTGGYVSFPVVLAAATLRLPVLLHEQNTIPGLTNRLCQIFARRVTVSYPGSISYFRKNKTVLTGNPVRREVLNAIRSVSRQKLNLDQKRKTVLVIGGSLGARRINEMVVDLMDYFTGEGIQVLHVVGQRDYGWVAGRTANRLIDFETEVPIIKGKKRQMTIAKHKLYHAIPFMYNIWDGLAASDLVVSRAGATILAEITLRGLPSIIIPFPYSAEGHQAKNASVMGAAGASIVIEESKLSSDVLRQSIRMVLDDIGRSRSMSEASKKLSNPYASGRIVDIIYNDILKIGVIRKAKIRKVVRGAR